MPGEIEVPVDGDDTVPYPGFERVDGRWVPARITPEDFRRYFLASFPKLADEVTYGELLEDVIDSVYAIFPGVNTLWDVHKWKTWYEKTRMCYRLLIAWYLGDLYPTLVAGVSLMGGIPLKRKKIGGVDLTFSDSATTSNVKDYEDVLIQLKSNPWGAKAYLMIKTSAKRVMIRNRTFI
jgi:hypothetical protein